MSRQNLIDVVAGLEKYHKNSPYLGDVKKELASRAAETPVYVAHQFNESNKYEYADSNPSNHTLVSIINSNSSAWKYYINEAWRRLTNKGRYVLHNEWYHHQNTPIYPAYDHTHTYPISDDGQPDS